MTITIPRPPFISLAILSTFLFSLCVFGDVRFTGSVRDTAGNGIAFATVALSGDTLATTTASDGSFVLAGRPANGIVPRSRTADVERLIIDRNGITLENPFGGPANLATYDIRGKRLDKVTSSARRIVLQAARASGVFVLAIDCKGIRRVFTFTAVGGRPLSHTTVPLGQSAAERLAKILADSGLVSGPSGLFYLAGQKAGFFNGFAVVNTDTAQGIAIVLRDSAAFTGQPAYKNPGLPIPQRVDDLVGRMTLQEKVSQMVQTSAAISRLGIPAYNWWSECLHGVALADLATVFPQAIGLAATFDDSLLTTVSQAISVEARAKYQKMLRENGSTTIMHGLTFFSPNINIFRDPRWGRGQETYGEDPYLTSRMAVAFIKGLQGDGSPYLRAAGTAKHFAAYSGPEATRTTFSAVASPQNLVATYFPAFRACVKDAGVASAMCAYNMVNGTYSCQNSMLLQQTLRQLWGFGGYVVSDCGANASLSAGCDLICYQSWSAQQPYSVAEPESLINVSLKRMLTVRFELGMFDPPEMVPFSGIPYDVVDCEAHRQLARRTARESIVLLKNAGAILPLRKDLGSIAVVGPNADLPNVLLGNYNGTPSYIVTPLQGIQQAVSAATQVNYAQGCGLADTSRAGFAQAESLAALSDAVVCVLGLSSQSAQPTLEGEGVDRTDIVLPGVQEDLLEAVAAKGKPVVLVLVNGGPVAVNWANDSAAAIVESWYGGQEGGNAIADVIFGDYNPGGRLPYTVYKSVGQLPDFTDYDMTKGRTYRYFTGLPLYPFGYGQSYTTFAYTSLAVSPPAPTTLDTLTASVSVQNTGTRAGDEVVELYVNVVGASATDPIRELKGFRRVNLQPGEKKQVSFPLSPYALSLVNGNGNHAIAPGSYAISAGGGQPGATGTAGCVSDTIVIGGQVRVLDE